MICLIREEQEKDYKQVHDVVRNAFFREDKPSDFNEWILVERIRDSEYYIEELSLVAEYNNQVIGHTIFTPITIHNQDITYNSLALGPVAVDPQYQNKGVGHRLIEEGIKQAKKLGYGFIIVMGHPNFYKKFGFQLASKWRIGIDENFNNEYIFALELIPGELEKISGIIRYCQLFYLDGELI